MDRFLWGVSRGAVLACSLPGLAAAQVVLEGGGVRLRAPAALDCAALPVIAVEGAIAAALAGDRTALTDVVSRMSLGIASACPAAEVLRFEGTDRGVTIAFRTEKAQGWRMPGTAAATTPAATPTTAAAPVATEAPAQQAAATPPPEPAIAPGVAFADLAQFYGGIPTVRGHAVLRRSEVWSRILAARAYAEHPEILLDDSVALEVAQFMLSEVEFQQFVGPVHQRIGHNFQGLSVFEKRDLAERVRRDLAPYLDQRRQTGRIDVVHVAPLRLGEYSFERSAFPFSSHPSRTNDQPGWRGYWIPQLLDAVVLPRELRTSPDEARQIDEFLRSRRNPDVYLGIFMSIDPRAPSNVAEPRQASLPRAATVVRQVALFFDEQLTQMVFDFTPVLAAQQADLTRLVDESSRPLATTSSLIMALSRVTGETALPERVTEEAVRTAGQWGFQDGDQVRRVVRESLTSANGSTLQRFAASITLEPFDPAQGGASVSAVRFQVDDNTNWNAEIGLPISASTALTISPEGLVLPMSSEIAARLFSSEMPATIEAFVDGDILPGRVSLANGRIQIEARIKPRRILLVTGSRNQPITERTLLADITM